mmetsp:Transcript_34104/g.109423  ORF Transcript_34104/g.109423 Transcript_34104/m.109423 type:complete len:429 (+) Transcript_34104:220-1506(+)
MAEPACMAARSLLLALCVVVVVSPVGAVASAQQGRLRQWPGDVAPSPLELNETVYVRGGCCGLGHRMSRLMKVYVYALSRSKGVVVDWGACVGTDVTNLWSEFFENQDELAAGAGGKRDEWIQVDADAVDWRPPSTGRLRSIHKEWELAFAHASVAPYASRFAALLARSLKPRWRSRLGRFLLKEFHSTKKKKVIGVHFRLGNGEQFSRKPVNTTKTVLRAAAAARQLATSLGFSSWRLFVATDDTDALELLRTHAPDLDVFARPQWRPPKGAGVAFSSWRLDDGLVDSPDLKERAHLDLVRDGESCVANSGDMLLDALLLGYTDALLLTVPSTFSVLPKAMAYARHVPFCAFLHYGAAPKKKTTGVAAGPPPGLSLLTPGGATADPSLVVTCFRQHDGRVAVTNLAIPADDDDPLNQTDALGSRWYI